METKNWLNEGKAYLKERKYDEAIIYFANAIGEAYHNIGEAFWEKGNKVKANEYYNKSINVTNKLFGNRPDNIDI